MVVEASEQVEASKIGMVRTASEGRLPPHPEEEAAASPRAIPKWHSVVAGNIGGIFGLSVSFPLDTLKVRIQTRPDEFTSASQALRHMVKQEGFMSLYRGILSPVLGFGLINATAFGTFNALKPMMLGPDASPDAKLSFGQSVIAGASAGITSAFVRAPVERVKTVMQANNSQSTKSPFPNSLVCLMHLAKHGGIPSVFNGVQATLAREVLQYGTYFWIFETICGLLRPADAAPDERLSPTSTFIAGGFAGAIQWLPPVYSIDVIKSRVQRAPPGTYAGLMDCARQAYQESGAVVFVRGLSLSMARAFALHGGIFLGFETVMGILKKL